MLYFGVLAHVVAQARLEFIPGQCHVVYHHTWFMLLDLFIYLFFWILVSRSVLLALQHPDSRLKLPGLKTLLGERAAVALYYGRPSLSEDVEYSARPCKFILIVALCSSHA